MLACIEGLVRGQGTKGKPGNWFPFLPFFHTFSLLLSYNVCKQVSYLYVPAKIKKNWSVFGT